MPYFCQCVRYMVCAKNFPFRSVPFCFRSLVVCYPFKIRSYSFQSLFEVRAHFPSVLNPFHIHLLHVAVYDFYSLLKSVRAHQQLTCGRKKEQILPFPIPIVLAPKSHTLFTCFFALVLPTLS